LARAAVVATRLEAAAAERRPLGGRNVMAAQFYVVGSFFISSRNLFVAVGDIVDGYIEPGMSVTVDFGNIQFGTSVSSVEIIDVSYLSKSYKGLAFGFQDPEELEFWRALDLSDQTLLIESA
jgi:hypothetical protein